jgi:hypothetical protein
MGRRLPASWEAGFPRHGKQASHVMGSRLPTPWKTFTNERRTLIVLLFNKLLARYKQAFGFSQIH